MLLACVLLYGPERIPLGAGQQWEIRVSLCVPHWGAPAVVVEERTYERTQRKDGTYLYRHPDKRVDAPAPDDAWWQETARKSLYLTTTEPPRDPQEGY